MPPERRSRSRASRRWLPHLRAPTTWALGATLLAAPMLLGGAYGWGVCITSAMACVSCGIAAWRAKAPSGLGLAEQLALVALAMTALQCVPLPIGVLEVLQPEAARLREDLAAFVGGSAAAPLSLSPIGTRGELVKGFGIVAALLTGAGLARRRRARAVFFAFASSTVALALVALAHEAVDANRVFGLYLPVQTNSPLLAPLMNPNHLSGLLAMGTPVMVGLALDERTPAARGWWLTGALTVAATAAMCVSRGGMLALFVGLAAMPVLGLVSRRGHSRRVVRGLAIGGLLTAALLVSLYAGFAVFFEDVTQGDRTKLTYAAQALGLALDYPFWGIGRGAFSAVFVQVEGTSTRVTHPENVVGQWLSEWGLVVGVLLLAGMATAWARAARDTRRWAQVGGLAALAALFAHDTVDFASEMSGVAVPAAALLGGCVGGRASRGALLRPLSAGVAGLGLIAVVVFGVGLDEASPARLRAAMTSAMDDPGDFARVRDEALRARPREPSIYLIAGAEAARRDDLSSIRWLNQAMRLAPGWDAPHVETARFLAGRGRLDQAFAEIQEADTLREGAGTDLACAILVQRPRSLGSLLDMATPRQESTEMLDRVAECVPLESEARRRIDEELIEREVVSALIRQARSERESAPERALERLEPLSQSARLDVQRERAEALLVLERPGEAREALDTVRASPQEGRGYRQLLARVQTAAGDAEAMRVTMESVRGLAAGRAPALARAWVLEGDLENNLGNRGRAMRAFERAYRIDPQGPGLARVAQHAAQLGDLARAYRAFTDLCRLRGEPTCPRAERIRRRMDESTRRPPQLDGSRRP